MRFVDQELAQTLEGAESRAAVEFATILAGRRPELGTIVEAIGGGSAVFAGRGSPLTEAKAIGLSGPVSEEDLDRLTAFFADRNVAARVMVCPLADPTFVEGLGRRGFRPTEFESVLIRSLDDVEDAPTPPPGIEVRQARADEAETYTDVTAPNFFGPDGLTPEMREFCKIMFDLPEAVPFLGFVDGRPAGGASVLIHEGVALLAGAATLPPFRNRGLHAAFSRARLAFAKKAGCGLAVQGAQPGSTSQRNAERVGYRLAYTKVVMVREPPARE